MRRIRLAGLLAALALLLPLSGTTATAATTPPHQGHTEHPALALPAPTGADRIGRTVLHLVDRGRADPWAPDRPRELMVSLYYPALATVGAPGRYLGRDEAALLVHGLQRDGELDPAAIAATRTHAYPRAVPEPRRHPLVVLSPGFSLNRGTLSVLAEDLTSRGYVVALVDHAYETFGTDFPGGRTLTCRACDIAGEPGEPSFADLVANRARDVSFLLDRLTHSRYATLIDRQRIGMAGHSIGGNAAVGAMDLDHRVRAGVNLDGGLFYPVPQHGLDHRPFLLLGTAQAHAPDGADTTWARDWPKLDGWKRWLTVAGAVHFDFTDLPVLADQLGVHDPGLPLPGARSAAITRDYVGAFFDAHLRGIRQPLLDGPSPAYPEVAFQHP